MLDLSTLEDTLSITSSVAQSSLATLVGEQGVNSKTLLAKLPTPEKAAFVDTQTMTMDKDATEIVPESTMSEQRPATDTNHTHIHLGAKEQYTGAKRTKETPQWPSESAILVAVRVRPFSAAESTHLPPTSTNKFNFSADGSLASGPGSGHSRGDSMDGNSAFSGTGTSRGSSTAIRKVVEVLDDRVLVFDPPDAESISKYKRALLPVQAYRRFKDMRYAFDRVFHEDAQQEEVFENTTRHLIDGVLDGYNGTLFAYGATGCGKTHTISGTPEKPGIIFLTMQELYERMKEQEDEKTIEISLSYLEVYNETIRDLLATPHSEATRPPSLHLREDSAKKISIAGLSAHHPKGMDALMDLIFKGNENRTMSPTEANATSSRSHAVLQINICQRPKTANVSEDFTVATLSLIDLAGSERASATKNRGSRLIEGANINKSLLALGNCINALCENKPKSHIPYRDSKLTRLLKFSLGGNCKTVMIACVSPSSQHYEETHNTLKYANRAKNIKTKVTKNTLNVDRHVSEYVQAIYELRQEVADLKGKLHNQAKSDEIEKAQQRQSAVCRDFEDTVRKMRATVQTARTTESKYANLQSELFITSARLSGLYRWRAGFDEACQAIELQQQKQDEERKLRASLGETEEDFASGARSKKSSRFISRPSAYIDMVDKLIDELNGQTVLLTRQMQEQEDALKLHAVSIQAIESQNSIGALGFPFQRMYELEKKCQALESHNKILTTKLELSDHSLSEQFLATEDFMELSARSLVGLRSEIDAVEHAGLPTQTLDSIYMSSITSFTEMNRRIQKLPETMAASGFSQGTNGGWSNSGTMPGLNGNQTFGGSSAGDGTLNSVGLTGSKMMSILPEVPQTPVKRPSTNFIFPNVNVSMDTVDVNQALGTGSRFDGQSPIRMFQDRARLMSPQPPMPGNTLKITTPRRKSTPIAGVVFSPKRKRVRGGLRQPRLVPTPTKRTVNFSLDIVAEDEDRYSTGMRDPSLAPLRPPIFQTILSPPGGQGIPSIGLTSGGKGGLGGGARRAATTTSIVSHGAVGQGPQGVQGGARRATTIAGNGSTGVGSKGDQATGIHRSAAVGPSNGFSSPTKRSRQAENDFSHAGKRARASGGTLPVSAATAARIARRQSNMPELRHSNHMGSSLGATQDRDMDILLTSPSNRLPNAQAAEIDLVSSTAGQSRIPLPSPPQALLKQSPTGLTKGPLRVDQPQRRKSMTRASKPTAMNYSALISTTLPTSRRRSLGLGGMGLGAGLVEGRMGDGVGGGPIRDASIRRRGRAAVSPPRDIPTFQQLAHYRLGGPSVAEVITTGAGNATAVDTSLDARRVNRRVSMMASLSMLPASNGNFEGLSRLESARANASANATRSTLPMPVSSANRRKSFGAGTSAPVRIWDSQPQLQSLGPTFDVQEAATVKPVNRRRSMMASMRAPAELSGTAAIIDFRGLGVPQVAVDKHHEMNMQHGDASTVGSMDLSSPFEQSETTQELIARLRQKREASASVKDTKASPPLLPRRIVGFGVGFDEPAKDQSGFSGDNRHSASPRPVQDQGFSGTTSPASRGEITTNASRAPSGSMTLGTSLRLASAATLLGSSVDSMPSTPTKSVPGTVPDTITFEGSVTNDVYMQSPRPVRAQAQVDPEAATPSPARSISRLSLLGSPASTLATSTSFPAISSPPISSSSSLLSSSLFPAQQRKSLDSFATIPEGAFSSSSSSSSVTSSCLLSSSSSAGMEKDIPEESGTLGGVATSFVSRLGTFWNGIKSNDRDL